MNLCASVLLIIRARIDDSKSDSRSTGDGPELGEGLSFTILRRGLQSAAVEMSVLQAFSSQEDRVGPSPCR